MSIMATAEFFVKPEKVEEFLAMMAKALPDTRAYEGCEGVDTYHNQDDPGQVLLVERWAERSNHESYLGWRMETNMMDALGPFISAPPKFAYFDARPEV